MRLGKPEHIVHYGAYRAIVHTHPSGSLKLSGGDHTIISKLSRGGKGQRSTVVVAPNGDPKRLPVDKK